MRHGRYGTKTSILTHSGSRTIGFAVMRQDQFFRRVNLPISGRGLGREKSEVLAPVAESDTTL
jgi:hypothetical protein